MENSVLDLFSEPTKQMVTMVRPEAVQSIDDLLKIQEATDKSHKLHAILDSWSKQQTEERKLRKLYAICFAILLALQTYFAEKKVLFVGDGDAIALGLAYLQKSGEIAEKTKVVPATMFSVDGVNYEPIPEGIYVTGSKYAIVLDEIVPEEFEIPIEAYEVACGGSAGQVASSYLKGHVDKACLELNLNRIPGTRDKTKLISFVARMKDPYAVFVK